MEQPPSVTDNKGLRGVLETGHSSADSSQASILLENGQRALVPMDALMRQEDGSYYLPFDLSAQEHKQRNADNAPVLTLPVIAEELSVEKRLVETNRLRINKTVHEHVETVDESVLQEEVIIERVPVNRALEAPIPAVRYEGDTTIISLFEEVLVLEKRLMLKEELHISKRQSTVPSTQTVTLRSEEVEIQRVEPASLPE